MANIADIHEVLKEAHDQGLIKQSGCVNICLCQIVNNANQLLYAIGRETTGVELVTVLCKTNLGERKALTYLRVLVKLGYLQSTRQLGQLDYTWKLAN